MSNYSALGSSGGGGGGNSRSGRPATTAVQQQRGLSRNLLTSQQQWQQQQQQRQQQSELQMSSGAVSPPTTAPFASPDAVSTSSGGGAGIGGVRADTTAVAAARRTSFLPARIQFCPRRRDVYGAVNCQPPERRREGEGATSVGAGTGPDVPPLASRTKKPGPVLLELRHLQPEVDPRLRRDGKCLESRTIAISRGNPSLGSGVASTCLSFRPGGAGVRSINAPSSTSVAAVGDGGSGDGVDNVHCATGLTSGALCLHTFYDLDDYIGNMSSNGSSTQASEEDGDVMESSKHIHSTVAYYAPRHHRPATSVAWRPGPTASELRYVAVGLTGSGGGGDRGGTTHAGGAYQRGRVGASAVGLHSSGGASGGGVGGAMAGSVGYGAGGYGGGGLAGGGGGDREFCCLVWDIEAQRQGTTVKGSAGQVPVRAPAYRFAHNTAVSSLSWLSSGNLLAVGTQNRGAVQLYDLRVSGANAPPASIYAHSDAVAGIEADPFRPHVFATFGGLKEPVKIWDERRRDACLGEIKMGEDETVSTIAWSTYPARSGTLALAVGDALKMFDTSVSGSRPAFSIMRHCPTPVQCVAFQPAVTEHGSANDRGDASAELYPHRMLAVQNDGAVRDLATYQVAPVDISKRDGRIVFSLGRTGWIGSEGKCKFDNSIYLFEFLLFGGNFLHILKIKIVYSFRAFPLVYFQQPLRRWTLLRCERPRKMYLRQ